MGLYNALEVDVRRSFANGLQFRGNYTWAKNLDDGSAWNTSVSGNTPAFVEFPLIPSWTGVRRQQMCAARPRSTAAMNFPLVRSITFSTTHRSRCNFVADGWTVSTIVALQTGFPFTPQLGYNPTGNGDTRNPVRPNWNPAFNGNLYPRTPSQYFNPLRFCRQPPGPTAMSLAIP